MRSIVQNALVVLHDQEHDELHALVLGVPRESTARLLARAEAEMDRLDPTGEDAPRRRHAHGQAHGRPAPDQARGARPADDGRSLLVARSTCSRRYAARVTRDVAAANAAKGL